MTVNKKAVSCVAFLVMVILLSSFSIPVHAAIVDRVVAFVDNVAITLSDFEVKYAEMAGVDPGIKKEEVLKAMVNRTLMIREAKRLRLETVSEEAMLKEYIDLKVRAFIRIRDEEVKEYYDKNSAEFQERKFESAKDEIEIYLIEKEVNRKLKTHIDELRARACVQIQLGQGY